MIIRQRIASSLLFVVVLLMAKSACAVTPPPGIPEYELEQMPGYTFLPSGAHFGSIHVMFETTTLDQFSQASGQRRAQSRDGDAGTSRYWLCYTTPATRIWLVSDSEMGGPEHAITEIVARHVADTAPTADCPALPERYGHVSLDDYPLWLGATRQNVNDHMKINGTKGPWRFSESYKKVPPGQCEEAWQGNWLSVQMSNGRVNTIDVGQITSC